MDKSEEHQLDKIDLRILQTLQKDGRITNQNLAERVNVIPACRESEGWIKLASSLPIRLISTRRYRPPHHLPGNDFGEEPHPGGIQRV